MLGADGGFGLAGAGMIPGADDEVVVVERGLVGGGDVIGVVGEGAGLVAVKGSGENEDGEMDAGDLGGSEGKLLPEAVDVGMLEPELEVGVGAAGIAVELIEGSFGEVEALGGVGPESLVAEDRFVEGAAAGVGEPLEHVAGHDVGLVGDVDGGADAGYGDDGDEVGRVLGCGLPLIAAGVGASEHGDLAVGPRLMGEPFDGVVAVLSIVDDGMEDAFRVAAAARVDVGVDVAAAGEVGAAGMGGCGGIGREHEDDRQGAGRGDGLIERCVEVDAVAHGDFDVHLQLVVGGLVLCAWRYRLGGLGDGGSNGKHSEACTEERGKDERTHVEEDSPAMRRWQRLICWR